MSCGLKYLTCSLLFLVSCCSLDAQNEWALHVDETLWPAAVDYELHGNIKSWAMVDGFGDVLRKVTFQNREEQLNFHGKESTAAYHQFFQAEVWKAEYEKKYAPSDINSDSTVKMMFNERMQLIEKQQGNVHEWSRFGPDGQILSHITSETFSQTIVGGGVESKKPKDALPDYTFSYTVSCIRIFKYDDSGVLQEFESYDDDPSKNLRIDYFYDSRGNLTGLDHFDHSNISWNLHPVDYLEKFIHADIDSSFEINKYYEDYWCTGVPAKEIWRYDSLGRKREYVCFNTSDRTPRFEVHWHYDKAGFLKTELQFDVEQGIPLYEIEFDKKGNVVHEQEYHPWNRIYTFMIEYY